MTICVPTHNAGKTLRRTLDSILAQTYPHIEILVSDNLSTDDTAKIVHGYAGHKVKYFWNPAGSELAENNWNHVLSLASGPFIALYHADDLYAPTMVSRQVEFLQSHPEVSSVFTMSQMINEKDRPIRMGIARLPDEFRGQTRFTFPQLFNATLKYCDFIRTPTLLTCRETLDALGVFDARFRTAADLDLWLRMAHYRPIGIIDEPLHLYRISAQQGSAQMERARTYEAHWFSVMDHYLAMPDVREIVRADALAFYEMQRSIDQVRRAMNFLSQGQAVEARSLLDTAHPWKHLFTARNRPYRLGQLMLGTMLWLTVQLGLARWGGQIAHKLYQLEVNRRQQPIRRGKS